MHLESIARALASGEPLQLSDLHAILALPAWDLLSSEERALVARAVAARTAEIYFQRLQGFARGDQRHEIALFERRGEIFALVPGGRVTLGYDGERALALDPAREKALRRYLVEANFFEGEDERLQGYLSFITTPLRTVELAPFLVAARPEPSGPLLRGERDPHDEIVAALAARGLRLPTSDEWEHACSGGSRALFRWGDDPQGDDGLGETQLSGGSIDVGPNGFGLHMTSDPYTCECVAEPRMMRGGDGGSRFCGGNYDTWSPLLTAFFEDLTDSPARAEYFEECAVRPVLSVR